jgi:hypothetical protein
MPESLGLILNTEKTKQNKKPNFSSLLAVLGSELRTLCLLGRHGTNWAILSHFCFSYFSDRVSSYCLGLTSDHNHSCVLPCPAYWLRWDVTNFLPGLELNHHPVIPDFWVVGIIAVSHQAHPRGKFQLSV